MPDFETLLKVVLRFSVATVKALQYFEAEMQHLLEERRARQASEEALTARLMKYKWGPVISLLWQMVFRRSDSEITAKASDVLEGLFMWMRERVEGKEEGPEIWMKRD